MRRHSKRERERERKETVCKKESGKKVRKGVGSVCRERGKREWER